MRFINYTQRLKIEWCFIHGITSKAAIADEIGCSLSTVYHEFKRDCWYWHTDVFGIDHKRYSAQKAQQDYDWKNSIRGQHDKLSNNWEFINFIEQQILGELASPAVALFRWRQLHDDFNISVKTLYRYIDCGLYFPNVTNNDLWEKSKRKRSYNHVHKAKRAPHGKSIERRPFIVSSRSTFGHWEMDSVIGKVKGKKQSLLMLTERLTRFQIIFRVTSKTSAQTFQALRKLSRLCDFPNLFKTITVDNGSEFQFKDIPDNVYYCHPFTSCERGSNERNNRIFRRFRPKGQSLAKMTDADCIFISNYMNDMPRKVLDWKTPRELFDFYTSKENIFQNLSQFY